MTNETMTEPDTNTKPCFGTTEYLVHEANKSHKKRVRYRNQSILLAALYISIHIGYTFVPANNIPMIITTAALQTLAAIATGARIGTYTAHVDIHRRNQIHADIATNTNIDVAHLLTHPEHATYETPYGKLTSINGLYNHRLEELHIWNNPHHTTKINTTIHTNLNTTKNT